MPASSCARCVHFATLSVLECGGSEVQMTLHISGKLASIGIVVAALITAFSAPRSELTGFLVDFVEPEAMVAVVPLAVTPTAVVTPTTRVISEFHAVQQGPQTNPRFVLRATGYNSMESQTDSTPHITATGARTTFGIVAVSRDLLGTDLPYGSLVRIRDLGAFHTGYGVGKFQHLLDSQQLFIVEDTMHARKRGQIDVWFESYDTAVNWGVRKVEVELVRYGREGTEFLPALASGFHATPVLLASR